MKFVRNSLALLIVGFLAITISAPVFAWGPTGHRTVGEIAQHHLTTKAAKKISEILDGLTLGEVAVWADDVRSDEKFKSASPLHYADIDEGKTYQTSPHSPKGDVIVAVKALYKFLKTHDRDSLKTTPQIKNITEAEALKFLVHFIGDIHQPLHAGGRDDEGATHFVVSFLSKKARTSLHAVWDSEIIDQTKLSYTEYSKYLDHVNDTKSWENLDFTGWLEEGVPLRAQIYNFNEDKNQDFARNKPTYFIGYNYIYKSKAVIEKRLQQAGIRLAFVVNSIY